MKQKLDKLNLCWLKKPPVIMQTECAECGLASLLMVFNYYGTSLNLVQLRNEHPISSHGANLTTLTSIAQKYQFDTHPVTVEMNEINALRLPCILH